MHRLRFCLAVFISILTLPVSVLAETANDPTVADTQIRDFAPILTQAGFYVDLPAVDSNQLFELIEAYRADLGDREHALRQYLEDNRLGARDVVITIILPGGLLYAALRKAKLQQAKGELAEITGDTLELSRDLVAMQAVAGELTVAELPARR